ncbi:MAG: phosphatase PAP2 family protein [Elusimicrobia bacterium]|nr:phosphatase PAP2 family protein [Elusimicrobiota bacterium]
MRKKYILTVLIMSLSCPLSAQNNYDFAQFKSESGLFLNQPGKWKRSSWLTLGVIGAGTVGVAQYDTAIKKSARIHAANADSFPVLVGGQWGGFFVTPILGLGLLTHGWTAGNGATKKLGFEIIQSAFYAEVVSTVIKTAAGRARPGTGRNSRTYKPFTFFKSSYNSFPGGHVDAAFSLATVLSRSTDSPVLKVLPYIPAGLTAASRVYENAHWASDCFFGAAIGYFTASWVMDLHEKKAKEGAGAAGLTIHPYLAGAAVGLGFTLNI